MPSPRVASAPVTAVRMALPTPAQSTVLASARPAANFSLIASPSFPSPFFIPVRIVVPSSPHFTPFTPFHRPFSRPGTAATSFGAAVRMPWASAPTMAPALWPSCSAFAVMASTRLVSSPTPAGISMSTSPGSISATVPTMPVTACMAAGIAWRIVPMKPVSTPLALPSTLRMIFSSSPGCRPSARALLTSAMASVAASTSGPKAGATTAPMVFFSPSPVYWNFCMLSSKAPRAERASSPSTPPSWCACLDTSRSASPPAVISGFSSLALLPNSSMARASRWVSFSMAPRASMASANTSSLSRSSPLESLMETPSCLKIFCWLFEPLPAFAICCSSFVTDLVIVSVSVSISRLTSPHSCSLSVDMPVTVAWVIRSSA